LTVGLGGVPEADGCHEVCEVDELLGYFVQVADRISQVIGVDLDPVFDAQPGLERLDL
jgi:hypothetical protein